MPHSPDCPHPTDDSLEQIGFVPQRRMVDWLHPAQLARTGLKAAIAATFGSYADKRELQAALAHVEGADDSYELKDGELWFDYTADLGDGFDATYSIARLLASDLTLGGDETKRGQFVILGGDQVYPTAARDEYQNRFIGPYRAAHPWEPHRVDGHYAPAMYALPGNHDWYDGLTSFLRIFCQRKGDRTGRWIGGWRTRQRRSYFALELPHDWWVWAVDSQLESDMDHPQLMYFELLAEEMKKRERPQKVILVTAAPTWGNCPGPKAPPTCRNYPEEFRTLAHFENTYVRAKGFELKLVIAGDLHHYTRYESSATTRITAGGGGAFLMGTEQMPPDLDLRGEPYTQAAAFPDRPESLKYASGIWRVPFRNPAFAVMLGAIYLLFAWLLHTGSRETLTSAADFAKAFMFNPLATTLGLVVIGSLWHFTHAQSTGYRSAARFTGALHGLAHVVLCCVLFAVIVSRLPAMPVVPFSLTVMALLFVLGGVLGSLLFAGYLLVSTRLTGAHGGDLFSSMAITDCKHFLRMRLDAAGKLTVFVIGLKKIAGDWKFEPPGEDCGRPWFQSKTFMSDAEHSPLVVEKFEVS